LSDIVVFKYEIWQFNATSQRYEFAEQIRENDILEWQYVESSGTDENELTARLKPKGIYRRFCPKTPADTQSIEPIILKKIRVTNGIKTSDYEAMVFRYADLNNETENVVEFLARDIKYIEARKLITTNRDFSTIREPSDDDTTTPAVELPAGFAKFIRNTSAKTILEELYQKAITAPLTIEYGAIGTPDATRNIKGMGTVNVNVANPPTVDVALEQVSLRDAKDTIFSSLAHPLNTFFNTQSGVINVEVREGRQVDGEVIRRRSMILNEEYTYEQGANYVASHGKANVTHKASDVKKIDFTSYELQEDYDFIAGNDADLLVTPTLTELKNQVSDARHFLKLNIKDPFAIMRAGDYFLFNNKTYTVIQIQETFKQGAANEYDFEIEEREE